MGTVILCHKCSGVLHGEGKGQLSGCVCISGWVRGFEPLLTLEQASIAQFKRIVESIVFMVYCGDDANSPAYRHELERVKKILSNCPIVKHGSIDWKRLAE